MTALLLMMGLSFASTLPEVVRQQAAETGAPVLICPVGPEAAKHARRLLIQVRGRSIHWQQLPVLGDQDRELQQALTRTGESCALRLTLTEDPAASLLAEAMGDCSTSFQTAVADFNDPPEPEPEPEPGPEPEPEPEPLPSKADSRRIWSAGAGYHHFTWMDQSLGHGVSVEWLIGRQLRLGSLQFRNSFSNGSTPERMSLGKFDVGMRYGIFDGPMHLQLDAGLGWLRFSGASDQLFLTGNVSLGLGVAYTAYSRKNTHLRIGPQATIDTAGMGQTLPITGIMMMMQIQADRS